MVPPRGSESGSRSRTHGRDLLNGGSGGSKMGCWSGGDGSMARVGAAGRGRRRLPLPRPEVMSSARLHHS